MAKKCMTEREKRRIACYEKYATKREEMKKAGNWQALATLPRDAARSRQRHRCALTGRPRGYLRKFGLCRNQFRELALRGDLPGVTKSSW